MDTPTNTCAQCKGDKPHLQRCGRCKQVYYCNVTCQKSHWSAHKAVCLVRQASTLPPSSPGVSRSATISPSSGPSPVPKPTPTPTPTPTPAPAPKSTPAPSDEPRPDEAPGSPHVHAFWAEMNEKNDCSCIPEYVRKMAKERTNLGKCANFECKLDKLPKMILPTMPMFQCKLPGKGGVPHLLNIVHCSQACSQTTARWMLQQNTALKGKQ